eukprot:GHVN01076047.1.p1 GENE.GHVN01076047.1~~GHVN01076047.1.p1  ORF type:complete len:107 (-),score=6.28 GHVN01076047.1:95-415(-)
MADGDETKKDKQQAALMSLPTETFYQLLFGLSVSGWTAVRRAESCMSEAALTSSLVEGIGSGRSGDFVSVTGIPKVSDQHKANLTSCRDLFVSKVEDYIQELQVAL